MDDVDETYLPVQVWNGTHSEDDVVHVVLDPCLMCYAVEYTVWFSGMQDDWWLRCDECGLLDAKQPFEHDGFIYSVLVNLSTWEIGYGE